jgi:hypothetical protein
MYNYKRMFSRASTFRTKLPNMAAKQQEQAVIAIMVLIFCTIFVVIGYSYFTSKQEGDSCSGKDDNAEYEYNDKRQCKFAKCVDGYVEDSDGVCVLDQSGEECAGSDQNANYETDILGECEFVSCESGYELGVGGTCVTTSAPPSPQNCVATPNAWGACSATCGGGTQTRGYTITTPESGGGTCPQRSQTDTQPCNTQACGSSSSPSPQNCVATPNAWGACSATCGGGTQTRGYTITTSESGGGTCPQRSQTDSQPCNEQACPPAANTTLFENRAKSDFSATIQGYIDDITTLGTDAMGDPERRCMGSIYTQFGSAKCTNATSTATGNKARGLYTSQVDNYTDSSTISKNIASHWVAKQNNVNCATNVNYNHFLSTGCVKMNDDTWAKMMKADRSEFADYEEETKYCPAVYYKVVSESDC